METRRPRKAAAVIRHCALPGLAILAALTGCGSPTIYRWGGYETSIRALYADAGQKSLARQMSALAREVEAARHGGRNLPPGVRAHLGYICYLNGYPEAAAEYLHAEREAFPESARFVEVVLERIR